MHVLWVHQHADFVGGAERYVADTAALLRARGVRCTLLYEVGGWTEPAFVSRFDSAFPIVALERQVRELRPDVVYVHQLPGDLPHEALRRGLAHGRASSDAPIVRFFHDHHLFCLRDSKITTLRGATCDRTIGLACYPCLGFVKRAEPGSKSPVRLRTVHALRAEQAVHRELDALVVGSTYMRDHVLAHGFSPQRVHRIPLFVRDAVRTAGGTSEASDQRETSQLLHVGALLRGKGLDVLLDAMALLPQPVRLRVVGEGKQEGVYREQVARLGLQSRVTFVGRVQHDALDREYRRATCVVVPSRSPETFSLVGPEALLRRTPVIASDVGGVREWLVPGETGLLFPSGDGTALSAAIRRLLADPAAAARWGERGRAWCLEHFRPESHVDRLLELFRGLQSRAGAA